MPLKFQECTIDLASHRGVRNGGEVFELAPLEQKLLVYLWAHAGQVTSTLDLMQEVWGWRADRVRRALDQGQRMPVTWVTHRVRNKIEGDPTRPVHLITCKGVGLRLDGVSEEDHSSHPVDDREVQLDNHRPTQNAMWVPRPDEENEARSRLGPGVPLVAAGPKGIGKSAFLEHQLSTHLGSQDRVVRIRLDSPHRIQTREPDRFMYDVCLDLGDQLNLDDEQVTAAWAGAGTGVRKLSRFLRDVALPAVPGRLFLVIDPADALTQLGPVPNELYAALRHWLEEAWRAPWDKLRVLLAVSTDPVLLTNEFRISPFNLAPPVRLREFGPDQTGQLLRGHGMDPTEEEQVLALRFTGGNPALLGLLGRESAERGLSVSGLFGRPLDERSLLLHHCEDRLAMLRANPRLGAAMHMILFRPEDPPEATSADQLVSAGLARRTGRVYTVHNALYERFFQERL